MATAAATTTTFPSTLPQSRQESASPRPLPSPRKDDALPITVDSPPRGSPVRVRRSKRARAAPIDEGAGPVAPPQRKSRGAKDPRSAGGATSATASPGKKNVRRSQRRLGRDETRKEAVEEEPAAGKARRRKTAVRAQTAKGILVVEEGKGSSLALVPCLPTNLTRGASNEGHNGWDGRWETVVDLVMWNNVARSAFWFGSGSMLFISSSLSRDVSFSPISVCCHFGVGVIGLAFLKDSAFQRQPEEPIRPFQLTEEDVLHAAQAVLPVANTLISKAQLVFSGDPSMTLKVLPALLFGAKFGHLLTIRGLLVTGFFCCFTLPKLYSCYSSQMYTKAKGLKDLILNSWKSCSCKKLVVAAAVTTFWNLISAKTRIMAALFCVVTLRYYCQYCRTNNNSQREIHGSREEEQAMVIED